jgi:hypothetical protein
MKRPAVWLVSWGLLAAGCASADCCSWWPFGFGTPKPEEYTVPPVADSRYSEPPKFPTQLVKPVLPTREGTEQRPGMGMGMGGGSRPGVAPGLQ